MNCEECPFKGSKQVPGGGFSTTPDGKITKVEYDRNYDVVVVAMAPAREELDRKSVV